MGRGYRKIREAFEIKLTFLDGPDDCQAFQLDGGVWLLGRGERFRSTSDDCLVSVDFLAEGEAHAMMAGCICQ